MVIFCEIPDNGIKMWINSHSLLNKIFGEVELKGFTKFSVALFARCLATRLLKIIFRFCRSSDLVRRTKSKQIHQPELFHSKNNYNGKQDL